MNTDYANILIKEATNTLLGRVGFNILRYELNKMEKNTTPLQAFPQAAISNKIWPKPFTKK